METFCGNAHFQIVTEECKHIYSKICRVIRTFFPSSLWKNNGLFRWVDRKAVLCWSTMPEHAATCEHLQRLYRASETKNYETAGSLMVHFNDYPVGAPSVQQWHSLAVKHILWGSDGLRKALDLQEMLFPSLTLASSFVMWGCLCVESRCRRRCLHEKT